MYRITEKGSEYLARLIKRMEDKHSFSEKDSVMAFILSTLSGRGEVDRHVVSDMRDKVTQSSSSRVDFDSRWAYLLSNGYVEEVEEDDDYDSSMGSAENRLWNSIKL